MRLIHPSRRLPSTRVHEQQCIAYRPAGWCGDIIHGPQDHSAHTDRSTRLDRTGSAGKDFYQLVPAQRQAILDANPRCKLAEGAESENVRLGAAKAVLELGSKLRQQGEFEERPAALEAA